MFNQKHLEFLFSCVGQKEESWKSPAIQPWAKSTLKKAELKNPPFNPEALPITDATRSDLHGYVADNKKQTADCVALILAWGGMNRVHGGNAFKAWNEWAFIAESLRSGEMERFEAYERFSKLREDGVLKGMGPAYYTKLIFFLSPHKNGYIMDQWTARSMNLLVEKPFIKLDGYKQVKRVSDKNTRDVYEQFCKTLELLTKQVSLTEHEETEMLIFSNGRGKGRWRNYVKQHS